MSSLLLKIKKAVETATTFNHVPFKTGDYTGKFVGLSKNKKNFYINVECKEREGAGFRTRTAILPIDPEIGLAFEDFEEQVDSEEITKLVFCSPPTPYAPHAYGTLLALLNLAW